MAKPDKKIKKKDVQKKKFNIKEYVPIIAIILAVVLFVGVFVIIDANEPTYIDATVYYKGANNQQVPQIVKVNEKKVEKGIVEALAHTPADKSLKPWINGEYKVLSAKTKDGLCTVNLSKSFAEENSDGVNEPYAVYAIVNSLCMLPDVNEVKININGNKDYILGDRVNLSHPFEPDWNMVVYESRPQ